MGNTKISDITRGESRDFEILLTENNVEQDITGDTVTLTIKDRRNDPDSSALLITNADVTTDGINGNAIFQLTPTQTDIVPGIYYLDIVWIRSSLKEYVVHTQIIRIIQRISDP